MSTRTPLFDDRDDHDFLHTAMYRKYDLALYETRRIAKVALNAVDGGLHTLIIELSRSELSDEETTQLAAVLSKGFDPNRVNAALNEIIRSAQFAIDDLNLLDQDAHKVEDLPENVSNDADTTEGELKIPPFTEDDPTTDQE